MRRTQHQQQWVCGMLTALEQPTAAAAAAAPTVWQLMTGARQRQQQRRGWRGRYDHGRASARAADSSSADSAAVMTRAWQRQQRRRSGRGRKHLGGASARAADSSSSADVGVEVMTRAGREGGCWGYGAGGCFHGVHNCARAGALPRLAQLTTVCATALQTLAFSGAGWARPGSTSSSGCATLLHTAHPSQSCRQLQVARASAQQQECIGCRLWLVWLARQTHIAAFASYHLAACLCGRSVQLVLLLRCHGRLKYFNGGQKASGSSCCRVYAVCLGNASNQHRPGPRITAAARTFAAGRRAFTTTCCKGLVFDGCECASIWCASLSQRRACSVCLPISVRQMELVCRPCFASDQIMTH